jgi:single-stranded-DNA-specific exonuclease
MSLTGKRWQVGRQEKEAAQEISKASRISTTLAQVLINRGLSGISEIDAFITPRLNFLSNPYDIPDMEKATQRVLLAKEKKERVAVYGDYDVDGVTGTAILLLTLKDLGIDATYYIPHRYSEGYGLNNGAIKKLFDEGVKLIVTDDCGISNVTEIEYANSLGMEVVVTDHHNPQEILPKAHSIVNPKLINGDHRARELSGAGVAFKFAWGLYRTAGIKDSANLMELLDLAGLGTIADIVPLLDENRVLAIYGLKSMNDCKRIGLKSLIEGAGIKKRITSSTVNFTISPRLNSAGRLEHASLSVELLTTKDELIAKKLALELNRLNSKRQSIGSQIQEEVFAKIGDKPERSIVLSGNSWNPGVIGIVASQVVDRYYRPAVLIGVNEGIGRGSARSIDGINIFNVLKECRDLFTDFGGHKKAAGFEVVEDNIPELTKRLKEIIDGLVSDEELVPTLEIESALDAKDITMSLASELELLDPHGEENPPPVFISCGLKLIDMRRVGDGTHLKARFTDGKVTLDSIGFSLGDLASKLKLGDLYDLAYNLEVNEFNGLESAQLNLVDIRNEEKQ